MTHEHDTHAPTPDARLTDEAAQFLAARAQFYLNEYKSDAPNTDAMSMLSAVRMLADDVLVIAADRATRVAENARLQDALVLAHEDIRFAESRTIIAEETLAAMRDRLAAARAQVAAMRPLVEVLAACACAFDDSTDDLKCIYCGAVAAVDWETDDDDEPDHKPDCLITLARAFVAQHPQATPAATVTPAPAEPTEVNDHG